MDITLLELHLPNAEFNAPFAGGRTDTDDEAAAESAAPSRPDRPGKLGPVATLLAFIGLALIARYLRGGEAEQTTLDEVEA